MCWIDNGMVQTISSFIGPDIGDDLNCWSAKDKAIINESCPNIIHQYNKHMGGPNLQDAYGIVSCKCGHQKMVSSYHLHKHRYC